MMLRTLMVAIDGSADGQPAIDLALALATRHGSRLVGCAVVDEPGIRLSQASVFPEGYGAPGDASLLAHARTECEAALARFEAACRAAGLSASTHLDYGTPHARLADEAHRFDLVLIGLHTHFEHGWITEPDSTHQHLLQECPRPVISVPALPDNPLDGPVLVAFDGSLRSSQALYDFVASGLGVGRPIHVLSVDREHDIAERTVEKAVSFLHAHQLDAQPHPFDGAYQPQHAIVGAVQRLNASLLVIGAFGQGPIREFFLGSTTRSLLEGAGIPVFTAH
ncbi:MAG: universal stress protein UspA [Isosphaeraceae bacterium]|jgi:nucleotide-binding universal stress UspA family protein|nr:MAG: universal stress protein UspA [Isosphaeraceae bacterium]